MSDGMADTAASEPLLQEGRPVSNHSLHSIIDRLSLLRKRSYPSDNQSAVDATMNDVVMSEDDGRSDSTVATSVSGSQVASFPNGVVYNSVGSASRRKSANPCKYVQSLCEESETEGPRRKRSPYIPDNTRYKVPTLCTGLSSDYYFRGNRMPRRPNSTVIRKLLSEIVNSVVAEVEAEAAPRRSGRRRKLWRSSISNLEASFQELPFDRTTEDDSARHDFSPSIQDQPPMLKRRRGRPPQLGNLSPSPSSIIPKLLADMVSAVSLEVDGTIAIKRRGRPPRSGVMPFSRSSSRRAGRGRGAPRDSAQRGGRALYDITPADILNTFFPPLLGASAADQQSTLPPLFSPNQLLLNAGDPNDMSNAAVSLMQCLPEAISQLAAAQTFQQTVAAAALAVAAQGDCGPRFARSERRRSRRSYASSNSFTHANLCSNQASDYAAPFLATPAKRRGRGGRPRGSGRGSRGGRVMTNSSYFSPTRQQQSQQDKPKQNGSAFPWFSL